MNVFILIPAYNEAHSIEAVIGELQPLGHTIVVIDDGSKDNTAAIARRSGAVVLSHCVNLGQGAALQTGIDYARMRHADAMVTFDADGQHCAADIENMLKILTERNVDIVLGSRFLGQAQDIPPFRKLLLKLMVFYTRYVTGLKLTDTNNGLRVMSVAGTRSIYLTQNRMAHASELLQQVARNTLRYAEAPSRITYTSYSLAKGQKSLNALNIVTDLLIGKLYR